jgi:hypothetical protein
MNSASDNYTPGPYTPFPVSGERSETPPPDFDPSHPFTGVELIVSGLPFTSITSAAEHLHQVIRDIVADGRSMPGLQIVSPSTRQPLDFVYVSLSGSLKETPRPDILEDVRGRLDIVDGLEARWKVRAEGLIKLVRLTLKWRKTLIRCRLSRALTIFFAKITMISSPLMSQMTLIEYFITFLKGAPSQRSPTLLSGLTTARTSLDDPDLFSPFMA